MSKRCHKSCYFLVWILPLTSLFLVFLEVSRHARTPLTESHLYLVVLPRSLSLRSRGGESVYGGKMEDEITRNLKHTGAGICAMANSGSPNTNGSQFYITLISTPKLDGKHTIFGRIYSGMSVRPSALLLRMDLMATSLNFFCFCLFFLLMTI